MIGRRTEILEPEDIAVLGSIFDEAWSAVASRFEQADAQTRASARTRLARVLLQLAGDEAGHDRIRQTAVLIFQQAATSRLRAE
jgi:hypothetical protein